MTIVMKDRAGIFGKREVLLSTDEQDVFQRIGRLFVREPKALEALLLKHNAIEPSGNLMSALAHKIADNDEDFNIELAALIAQQRFSRIEPITITALITGIAAVMGGGMGLWKSGLDKKSQADAIRGQIQLTVMQQQEAEKRRKTQITLLIIGFLLLIITIITIFLFRGLNATSK